MPTSVSNHARSGFLGKLRGPPLTHVLPVAAASRATTCLLMGGTSPSPSFIPTEEQQPRGGWAPGAGQPLQVEPKAVRLPCLPQPLQPCILRDQGREMEVASQEPR